MTAMRSMADYFSNVDEERKYYQLDISRKQATQIDDEGELAPYPSHNQTTGSAWVSQDPHSAQANVFIEFNLPDFFIQFHGYWLWCIVDIKIVGTPSLMEGLSKPPLIEIDLADVVDSVIPSPFSTITGAVAYVRQAAYGKLKDHAKLRVFFDTNFDPEKLVEGVMFFVTYTINLAVFGSDLSVEDSSNLSERTGSDYSLLEDAQTP